MLFRQIQLEACSSLPPTFQSGVPQLRKFYTHRWMYTTMFLLFPPLLGGFYFNCIFFFFYLSGNQVAWNPMNLWTPFLKATIQLVLDGKVSESLLYFFFFFLPHCWMVSLSGITPINKSKHNLMLHLSNQLVSASYSNYSITFKSSRLNKWVLVTSHLESFYLFIFFWSSGITLKYIKGRHNKRLLEV